MRLQLQPDQTPKLQTAGIFLAGFGALIALLYFGRALCITLVVSVILSFILEPFVSLLMRVRLPRSAASFAVCLVALVFLYLIGLGIFSQITIFAEELPGYSSRMNELVDGIADRLDRSEQNMYRLLVPKRFQTTVSTPSDQPLAQPKRRKRNEPLPPPPVQEVHIRQDRASLFNYVYGYASSFYNVLLMTSFVPFLVFFTLSWRDRIRLRFLSMFDGEERLTAVHAWESIAHVARAYVVGNFLLGLVLSAVSCVVFWSWHLPYWMLIGFASGFLSLVPYVGLPLALIPPIAAALVTYDTLTPYLIIAAIVGLLHLLAMNLLYPYVVGARVHLNPLAVTVALMFWGTIWGVAGLILAIPVTAGFKAVLESNPRLKPWSRLLGD